MNLSSQIILLLLTSIGFAQQAVEKEAPSGYVLFHGFVLATKTVTLGSNKRSKVYKTTLILDVEIMKHITSLYEHRFGSEDIKQGWVFEKDFEPMSKEQMIKRIDDRKQTQ